MELRQVDAMKIDWERIESIINQAAKTYTGDMNVLESAIGALVMGQFFGWRVLRIIHGSSAYARYQRILGVRFMDVCPDHTKLSRRNNGYRWVEDFGAYWKAINEGLIPSELRARLTK